ncbi:unnamed protein product, partial [Ectocarpus sp. 13 AM-2016]
PTKASRVWRVLPTACGVTCTRKSTHRFRGAATTDRANHKHQQFSSGGGTRCGERRGDVKGSGRAVPPFCWWRPWCRTRWLLVTSRAVTTATRRPDHRHQAGAPLVHPPTAKP